MHIGLWNIIIVSSNARRTPKLHTMPWSHQALRGSMGLRRSRRCTWRSSNVFFKSQRKTIRPDVANALAAYPCASIINCVTFCLGSHAGVIQSSEILSETSKGISVLPFPRPIYRWDQAEVWEEFGIGGWCVVSCTSRQILKFMVPP